MADEAEVTDFSKVPLEEKIVHKNWRARVSAYDDLVRLFNSLDDEKAPEWARYSSSVRKISADSNAAALEKGLEVVLIFVENAGCAPRSVPDIVSGVVSKCMTASRAKTKELSTNIILMGIEIEKYEAVMEEMMKGMEQKNPKVIMSCISVVTQALSVFGPKILNLKVLIKKAITLLEDRDKGVRDESKKLTIELYRWISSALKPQLTGLKPVLLQELEAEFAKVSDGKPTQTRFLRSQQTRPEKMASSTNDDETVDSNDDDGVPDIDPYDLIDSANVLSKLSKDFYEKCESKKWAERKEALESLDAITQFPKLDSGDYGDLIRTLKRILGKDTNVIVVTLAGKNIAQLANGLKKKFAPYASACIEVILDKFKERKANVVAVLKDAIDNCFFASSFEQISEDVNGALQNKNPAVKLETSNFLARNFAKAATVTMQDKKIMKTYYTNLVANLNDSDSTVRDASAEALGVALKAAGERTINPFLVDVEPIKLAKIKEFAEKAVITPPKGSKPPKKEPPPKKLSAPAAGPKRPTISKPAATVAPAVAKKAESNPPAARISAPKARPSTVGKKNDSEPIGTNLPVSNAKHIRIVDENKLKILRWNFTTPREEYIELLKELMKTAGLGKTLQTNMFHSDFKNHIKALDTLTDELGCGIDGTLSNLDLILKWITIRFFDTNPSVILKSLDYLQNVFASLAQMNYGMHDLEASAFVPYLLLKIGDPKDNVRNSVHNILRQMLDMISPQKIFQYVMEGVKSKNARQRAECLEELAYLIKNMGVSVIQPSPSTAMKEIARQISDRDNAVRNAALNAVIQAYFHEGDKALKMIGQLPEKDQSLLDERLKRAAKSRPPAAQQPQKAAVAHVAPQSPPAAQPAPVSLNTLTYPRKSPANTAVQGQNSLSPKSKMACVFPPEAYHVQRMTPVAHHPQFSTDESDDDPEHGNIPVPAYVKRGVPPLPAQYRINFDDYWNMFGEDDNLPMEDLKLHDTNIDFIYDDTPALPTRMKEHQASIPSNVPVPDQLGPIPRMIPRCAANLTMNRVDPRPATQNVQALNPPVPVPSCPSTSSVDYLVSQVGHAEFPTASDSINELRQLLMNARCLSMLSVRVDNIVLMMNMQMRRLADFSNNPMDPEVRQNGFNKTLELAALFYKHFSLASRVTTTPTQEFMFSLLSIISNPDFIAVDTQERIAKPINTLVVRIIEKSDPSVILCSLPIMMNRIRSLRVVCIDNKYYHKIEDLVLKCCWKTLKQFGVWTEDHVQWDVRKILEELNKLMIAHPFSSYIGDDDSVSVKTWKTLMHSMVMHIGAEDIRTYMFAMPHMNGTDAGNYMNRLVQKELRRLEFGEETTLRDNDSTIKN